jgi:hypothetical protein
MGYQDSRYGPVHEHYGARPCPTGCGYPRPKERKLKVIASTALWCGDVETGHAFSSKDEKKRRLVEERTKKDKYDDEVTVQEEFWVCGPCGDRAKEVRKQMANLAAGHPKEPSPEATDEEPVDAEIVP